VPFFLPAVPLYIGASRLTRAQGLHGMIGKMEKELERRGRTENFLSMETALGLVLLKSELKMYL